MFLKDDSCSVEHGMNLIISKTSSAEVPRFMWDDIHGNPAELFLLPTN